MGEKRTEVEKAAETELVPGRTTEDKEAGGKDGHRTQQTLQKEPAAQKEAEPQKKIMSEGAAHIRKGRPSVILGILAVVVSFFLLLLCFQIYRTAGEIGWTVGETGGKFAGLAVGSFQGITEEIPKGWAEGKRQGLSAEDTEVHIEEKIEEIGRLEVLLAGVTLEDNLKIGDDYNAVYIYKANAVFSVDLKDASIKKGDGVIEVTLAEPLVELYIDEAATEKIAEWQRQFFDGKTTDGYEAYMNTRKEIDKKAPEEIKNYDTLMSQAKESARNQLAILIKAVCGGNIKVEILFAGEENQDGR